MNGCQGLAPLFLSTDQADHREAAAICADCPALDWCRDQTRRAVHDFPGGLEGTWAGALYINGRIASGRASFGTCPTCGATDGKPCISKTGKAVGQPHLARHQGDPACRICGSTFKPSRRHFRFCSEGCATEATRRKNKRYDDKRPVVLNGDRKRSAA